jgi:hypothetical protein
MQSLTVDVQGAPLHIIYRGHSDCHFFSVTRSSAHGIIAVASVDGAKYAAAGANDIAKAAAVESETVLGRKETTVATVVARRLAGALAASGDFRPLTLCLNIADPAEDAAPEARRAYVQTIVAAAIQVSQMR